MPLYEYKCSQCGEKFESWCASRTPMPRYPARSAAQGRPSGRSRHSAGPVEALGLRAPAVAALAWRWLRGLVSGVVYLAYARVPGKPKYLTVENVSWKQRRRPSLW